MLNKQVTHTGEEAGNNYDELVTENVEKMDELNWWKDGKFPIELYFIEKLNGFLENGYYN